MKYFKQAAVDNTSLKIFLILLLTIIVTIPLFNSIWIKYTMLSYAAISTVCVVTAIMIVLVVWCTYDKIPLENFHQMGLGFFMSAVFGIISIYYFPEYNRGVSVISQDYALLNRLVEALVFTSFSHNFFQKKINKWHGLVSALISAYIISALLIYYSRTISLTKIYLPGQMAIKLLIAGLFILNAAKIINKKNNRYMLSYKYFFMAQILGLVMTICFFPVYNPDSFFYTWGYVIRMAYYCCLFKGVFFSVINYSYEIIEKTSSYMYEAFNVMPVALTTYDSNLRLTFINNKCTEMLGYKAVELTGLTVQEIEDKIYSEESYKKHVIKDIQESNFYTIQNKIRTFITKNGEKVKTLVDVYKLENGGYLCLFDEVKNTQVLENILLQTKTILNAVNNLVAIFDSNKKIIMCNEAFIKAVEMDKKELLGISVKELSAILKFKQKDSEELMVLEESQGMVEASFTTPNGNIKEILYHSCSIRNIESKVIGYICVCSDISSYKRENEMIRQQEKLAMLGQMAAGIVHEVKNPLTAILGFSQLISYKALEENIKEYAQFIENEVHGMNKVVSDFLTFARPQQPVLNEISLNKLINSLQLILETHLFTKNIKVHFDLFSEEKIVRVDVNQIKQVILNIVQNAVEAVQGITNPQIMISTRYCQDSNEMHLEIYDNGRGMTEEELKKIGTPFYSTKSKGTGLGLSICFNIIQEHGGRINIESKPGLGTTFVLAFPVYRPDCTLI